MLYADFGALGADKRSCYEILLEQTGFQVTVTQIERQHSRAGRMIDWAWPWRPFRATSSRLYRGRGA